mgnify:FL=1
MLYIPGITTIVVVVWSGLAVDLGADDGVVEVVLAMVVVGIVVVGLGNSASPSASTKEL